MVVSSTAGYGAWRGATGETLPAGRHVVPSSAAAPLLQLISSSSRICLLGIQHAYHCLDSSSLMYCRRLGVRIRCVAVVLCHAVPPWPCSTCGAPSARCASGRRPPWHHCCWQPATRGSAAACRTRGSCSTSPWAPQRSVRVSSSALICARGGWGGWVRVAEVEPLWDHHSPPIKQCDTGGM